MVVDLRETKGCIYGEKFGIKVFVINKKITSDDLDNIFLEAESDKGWMYFAVRDETVKIAFQEYGIVLKKNFYGKKVGRCSKGYEAEFVKAIYDYVNSQEK